MKKTFRFLFVFCVAMIFDTQIIFAQTTKAGAIVTTVGIFDGILHSDVHGQRESVYKINEYDIYSKDIPKSKADSLKGKKVRVTGKLALLCKTMVSENSKGEIIQERGPDHKYIFEPKIFNS